VFACCSACACFLRVSAWSSAPSYKFVAAQCVKSEAVCHPYAAAAARKSTSVAIAAEARQSLLVHSGVLSGGATAKVHEVHENYAQTLTSRHPRLGQVSPRKCAPPHACQRQALYWHTRIRRPPASAFKAKFATIPLVCQRTARYAREARETHAYATVRQLPPAVRACANRCVRAIAARLRGGHLSSASPFQLRMNNVAQSQLSTALHHAWSPSSLALRAADMASAGAVCHASILRS
jgi:hypothetical protein